MKCLEKKPSEKNLVEKKPTISQPRLNFSNGGFGKKKIIAVALVILLVVNLVLVGTKKIPYYFFWLVLLASYIFVKHVLIKIK